jgi:hypothetical protein
MKCVVGGRFENTSQKSTEYTTSSPGRHNEEDPGDEVAEYRKAQKKPWERGYTVEV